MVNITRKKVREKFIIIKLILWKAKFYNLESKMQFSVELSDEFSEYQNSVCD